MMKPLRTLTRVRRAVLLDQWMTPAVILRGKGWSWPEIHGALRGIGEPVGRRPRAFISIMAARYRRLVRLCLRRMP